MRFTEHKYGQNDAELPCSDEQKEKDTEVDSGGDEVNHKDGDDEYKFVDEGTDADGPYSAEKHHANDCDSIDFTEEDKISFKSITLEEATVVDVTLEKSGGMLGFSISGVQVSHCNIKGIGSHFHNVFSTFFKSLPVAPLDLLGILKN